MNTIARLDDGLSTVGEIIEYPEELEGGRNFFEKNYLSDRDNYYKGGYSVTKKVWNLVPNKTYTVSALELRSFGDDEWGVLDIMDGTNGVIEFSEEGFTIITNVFNRRGVSSPTAPVRNFYHTFKTPKSGKIYFSYYDHYRGASEMGYWFTDKFIEPKLELGDTITPWTPAPEDLGLSYPDWVQNFTTSFSENGVIAQEFIEGDNISIGKEVTTQHIKEGGL